MQWSMKNAVLYPATGRYVDGRMGVSSDGAKLQIIAFAKSSARAEADKAL
jgi:hypothetical protein